MLAEALHYTQVADQQLIAIFQDQKNISLKAQTLFCHVLNAQHIWANRILGRPAKYGVWDTYGIELFPEISSANAELFDQILENSALEEEISYTTSNGQHYTGVIKDILFHVFNHSTYHRGQIATLLKAGEITPPITDYIILKRKGQL